MSGEIDLPPALLVVNVVLPPLFLPGEGEEGDGEGAGHLYGLADGQERSGLVVEEAFYLVVEVD